MASVLIVDDDAQMRRMLVKMLSARGYGVEAVADGQRALERISVKRPDLVITDMRMPGMTGLEMIKKLRQDHPDLAVLSMSGGSAEQDGEDYLELSRILGDRCILTKPVPMRDLVDRIEQVLVSGAWVDRAWQGE